MLLYTQSILALPLSRTSPSTSLPPSPNLVLMMSSSLSLTSPLKKLSLFLQILPSRPKALQSSSYIIGLNISVSHEPSLVIEDRNSSPNSHKPSTTLVESKGPLQQLSTHRPTDKQNVSIKNLKSTYDSSSTLY